MLMNASVVSTSSVCPGIPEVLCLGHLLTLSSLLQFHCVQASRRQRKKRSHCIVRFWTGQFRLRMGKRLTYSLPTPMIVA